MLNFLKNGQAKILNLFFQNPDKNFYLREIARILGKEKAPAIFKNALDNLVESGILIDERRGNMRFFKLNKNCPLCEDLKRIISKTIGIEKKIKEMVDNFNDIKIAFIFGSIAKNKEHLTSDIDLMLIGKIDEDLLIDEIDKLETELKREINYHIFNEEEIIDNLKKGDNFLISIFNQPLIILKGNLNEIRKILK